MFASVANLIVCIVLQIFQRIQSQLPVNFFCILILTIFQRYIRFIWKCFLFVKKVNIMLIQSENINDLGISFFVIDS